MTGVRDGPALAGEAPATGVVVTLSDAQAGSPRSHEAVTRREVAKHLAGLKGYAFGGEYDGAREYEGHLYFVPADTVVGREAAAHLGIRDENDIYGAVVPHGFMAVKTITHPVLDEHAHAPKAWCHRFCDKVRDAVLGGYAAFHRDDARRATSAMLQRGAVRVKRATGIGGQGQFVVETLDELGPVLDMIDDEEIDSVGIVIEENLYEVVTHSVGQVQVDGVIASYCGTQRLTENNRGTYVYGGSSLLVARGDFEALLTLVLPDETRTAIDRARRYDAAALEHFEGMFASRRNYDVAWGSNAHGEARCGVLEQSWRMGGASGAEIGALEAFRDDPALSVVRASSTEVYGECAPPPDAIVYFRDVDERVGMLTKYTLVERHAHP